MKKRIVLALGGNALQRDGEVTAEAQKKVADAVGAVIADLAGKYEIVVAHGNGPQVGNILIHEEQAASAKAPAMPLETAVAMSQGQIGYWLTQAINNAFLKKSGRNAKIVTIVTQVVVDKNDPAFKDPSKPIGQFYTAQEAKKLARANNWTVKEDSGRGWRRVVASPQPQDIVEKRAIINLVEDGTIVIAAGGGGIPVYRTKILKRLKGVDAVIDKDFAAERLAELVKADIFVSVTAVPNVYINYGTPDQQALNAVTPSELLGHLSDFRAGSMLPKVQAAIKFANKRPGNLGVITDIAHLRDALSSTPTSGTLIRKRP